MHRNIENPLSRAFPALVLCAGAVLAGCSAAPEEAFDEVGQVQQAACVAPGDGSVVVYVAPNGDDDAGGGCNAPLASLEGANRWLRARYGYDTTRSSSGKYSDACDLHDTHTIYVRGGTYEDQFVDWDCTSRDKRTRILAYPGERSVFDGLGNQRSAFRLKKVGPTYVEIDGITWRHYVSNVIQLAGDYEVAENKTQDEIDRVTERRDAGANGYNRVTNNVFEENGDLYRTTCVYKDAPCVGYGVIDTFNSDHNHYANNIFYRVENLEDDAVYPKEHHSKHMMHAFYLAMDSDANFVGDNYIALTSGSPIKLRDGADDNHIHANYITDSGSTGFIMCSSPQSSGSIELPCQNNRVTSNSFTFGYPWPDTYSRSTRVANPVPIFDIGIDDYMTFTDPVFIEDLTVIHDGERQVEEFVGAMAIGDLKHIGTDQVVVALNYPNFHKIVATRGDGTPYLSRLLYATDDKWSVDALAIGSFDSSGDQQLIVARNKPGWAELWRGDGHLNYMVRGSSPALNLGRLYRNDDWTINALAAGDFDDSGRDQLLSSFKSASGSTRIYRGNGRTGIGSSIYSSTYWDISAMTAGDLDSDGDDELVVAFRHTGSGGSSTLRIYSGNGVTSATSGGYDYSSTTRDVTALTLGFPGRSSDPRPSRPTLFTAFRPVDGDGYREVYTGTVEDPRDTRLYRNKSWDIAAMVAGELDPKRHDTLVTAFDWPSRTQIHMANGTSKATGLGTLHRFTAATP